MSDEKAGDRVGKVVIVDEVIVEVLIQTVVDKLLMFVVDINQLTT